MKSILILMSDGVVEKLKIDDYESVKFENGVCSVYKKKEDGEMVVTHIPIARIRYAEEKY